jgi:putative Mn2+ efflux pump MntP
MSLLYVVTFAALQNLDNFVLAAAYRWRQVEIKGGANLLIAALSGLFTGAAVLAAQYAKLQAARTGWGAYSEIVGRGLLAMIGTWTLIGYFRTRLLPRLPDDPMPTVCEAAPGPMRLEEALLVGIALAVDNLGPSFAFGIVAPKWFGLVLSVLAALLSFVLIIAGQSVGAKGRDMLHCFSPKLVAGCLIVAVAIFDPSDFNRDGVLIPNGVSTQQRK